MSDESGARARASAQVDVFDVSDGYSADVSPASLAFGSGSGGSASVSASMSSGRSQVACSIASVSAPPGVTAEASGRTLSVSAAPGFSPGPVSFDVVEDGADPVSLRRSVYVASVERGAPGPPGADGKDADPEAVARIEAAAGEAAEAAQAARSDAAAAREDAARASERSAALALLVRDTPQGVVVGRDDGTGSFPDGSTRQSGSAFEVLDAAKRVVASLARDAIWLLSGRFSVTAEEYGAGAAGTGVYAVLRSSLMRIIAPDGIEIGTSPDARMRLAKGGGFSIESSSLPLGGGARLLHDPDLNAVKAVVEHGGRKTTLAVTNNGVWVDGEIAVRRSLVYSAPSGANGFTSPALSESAAGFRYMEVYYHDNDGFCGSVAVPRPDGKKVTLMSGFSTNDNAWLKMRTVLISGKSVSTVQSGTNLTGDVQLSGGVSNAYEAHIVIDEIVGYR